MSDEKQKIKEELERKNAQARNIPNIKITIERYDTIQKIYVWTDEVKGNTNNLQKLRRDIAKILEAKA